MKLPFTSSNLHSAETRETASGNRTSSGTEESCNTTLSSQLLFKFQISELLQLGISTDSGDIENVYFTEREDVVRIQVCNAQYIPYKPFGARADERTSREKVPVLSIDIVKLSELFQNSSEITRLFLLQEDSWRSKPLYCPSQFFTNRDNDLNPRTQNTAMLFTWEKYHVQDLT